MVDYRVMSARELCDLAYELDVMIERAGEGSIRGLLRLARRKVVKRLVEVQCPPRCIY